VWAIVKVLTSCLNPVVMTYVMNQSCGHWLLCNVLFFAITLIIKLQSELVEMVQISNGIEVLDQFDFELIF
jgi:ABC-type transporter MlaC component